MKPKKKRKTLAQSVLEALAPGSGLTIAKLKKAKKMLSMQGTSSKAQAYRAAKAHMFAQVAGDQIRGAQMTKLIKVDGDINVFFAGADTFQGVSWTGKGDTVAELEQLIAVLERKGVGRLQLSLIDDSGTPIDRTVDLSTGLVYLREVCRFHLDLGYEDLMEHLNNLFGS